MTNSVDPLRILSQSRRDVGRPKNKWAFWSRNRPKA